MKRFAIPFCCLVVIVGWAYAQDKNDAKPKASKEDPKAAAKKKDDSIELKTLKQKVSYGIGLNIGRSIARDGLDIDADLLAQGIKDIMADKKPRLEDEEVRAALVEFQKQMNAKASEKDKLAADKNKKAGEAFLAANKKKEGVVTTKSGLQYKILRAGKGATPKATDRVRTHYHGTLIDGTVFDSSVDDEPVTFGVGGVIPGWTEALQLMKVGGKWKLFIPSELAYKASGSGTKIGPNSTLIFEIELLAIE